MCLFYIVNGTSRISSLPSLTFSVAPTTSWWILSISVSCDKNWDVWSADVKALLNTLHLSDWGNDMEGTLLTCCKTFSAKISWSLEISTTFPSICLVGTKSKHDISHQHNMPSISKPFQMALVSPGYVWCWVIFTSGVLFHLEQTHPRFSVATTTTMSCPRVILILSHALVVSVTWHFYCEDGRDTAHMCLCITTVPQLTLFPTWTKWNYQPTPVIVKLFRGVFLKERVCWCTHLTSSTRLFISLINLWFSCSN